MELKVIASADGPKLLVLNLYYLKDGLTGVNERQQQTATPPMNP
jgi:hypothetical protein